MQALQCPSDLASLIPSTASTLPKMCVSWSRGSAVTAKLLGCWCSAATRRASGCLSC